MSLYAIGDLHLHFSSPLKIPSQSRGIWKGREARVLSACRELIREEDTLVLAGDHSWGRSLDEAMEDLLWIAGLPGRKILLRGNHDMFWDAKKTAQLNERFDGRLLFLQNNFFPYRDCALIGTKGYTFEGPFWLDRLGRIVRWDEREEARAERLVARELQRLRASYASAAQAGYRRFILFLHYPPTSVLEEDSPFTHAAEEFGAEQVVYAHCHGEARFHDSILGEKNGVRYSLVSGDYLRWRPMKVLD